MPPSSAKEPKAPKASKEMPTRYRKGVGIVLVNGNKEIFVAQRADAFSRYWQMPQGGIEPNESPLHAALRELKEETGIQSVTLLKHTQQWLQYDLPAELLGRLWNGRYRGQQQKWFLMQFTGTSADIDLQAHTPAEFIRYRWSAVPEVIAHVVPFKRALYQEIMRAFAPFLSVSVSSQERERVDIDTQAHR
ncbi:MAG: RNA pyrophosphohydrolase [Alphaproteobacteria bacterium GM202ARS2]|nr:RNA pyrophosphohydrolase [Alphaproteobacteria bacterium GM202ARS2]